MRTRLTHSFEVSTIGRALGEGAAKLVKSQYQQLHFSPRDIGTVVATACLLHDIGNPPFGHSGETAIGDWFNENVSNKGLKISDDQELKDLTRFEGNAQAFRIATRLQWSGAEFGMNLTAAALSTLIKYPCASNESKGNAGAQSLKKFGYFKSDAYAFGEIRKLTGLVDHQRHPLTYLMEAADDIGYAAGDLEDVMKKGFVDYHTIREALHKVKAKESKECVSKFLEKPYNEEFKNLDPRERRQLSVQRFCQMAVRLMMKSAIEAFSKNFDLIMQQKLNKDLAGVMSMRDLCSELKDIMTQHVYPHLEIAQREQTARSVIAGLLEAVMGEVQERPKGPLASFTYRGAPKHASDCQVSENYQIAFRAVDYVAGMTDGHALAHFHRIVGINAQY